MIQRWRAGGFADDLDDLVVVLAAGRARGRGGVGDRQRQVVDLGGSVAVLGLRRLQLGLDRRRGLDQRGTVVGVGLADLLGCGVGSPPELLDTRHRSPPRLVRGQQSVDLARGRALAYGAVAVLGIVAETSEVDHGNRGYRCRPGPRRRRGSG